LDVSDVSYFATMLHSARLVAEYARLLAVEYEFELPSLVAGASLMPPETLLETAGGNALPISNERQAPTSTETPDVVDKYINRLPPIDALPVVDSPPADTLHADRFDASRLYAERFDTSRLHAERFDMFALQDHRFDMCALHDQRFDAYALHDHKFDV